jgi:hypothetical protein
MVEIFRQRVRQLILRRDVLYADLLLYLHVSYMMKFNINVLRPLVKLGVVNKTYG